MEVLAPLHWHSIDFISDLHLQAEQPDTFNAFRNYLEQTTADALFILGDLFEVWVGDDVLSGNCSSETSFFARMCTEALRGASSRLSIFIMQGNRDFLMGWQLAQACASTLMEDPTVLDFGSQRWLLTHGDAFCVDDVAYMQFRAMVRAHRWQQDFLQKTLQERLAVAKQIRGQSEARKVKEAVYADVDNTAALGSLRAAQANHMIHGHTHRPDRHVLGAEHDRWVLSDWDLTAHPPRAEVLTLSLTSTSHHTAVQIQRISLADTGTTEATTVD